MSDNLDLTMRLELTGADRAAADVSKVREAIASIAEPARRAQAQVRRMAEAFEAVTTSARKAADAAAATVERMNTAIATEARQLRTELSTTFSPLGTSAKENATAATTAMSGMTAETTSAIERIRAAAATAFEPIAASMTGAAESIGAGFTKINAAMAETVAQAKAAAKEIAALNAPTPGAVPGSRNSNLRNAAGRGHGGPHFRAEGIKVPGGHLSIGSTPIMAAGAVAGYSVWEAMKTQDEALKLALTSQVDPALLGVSSEQYQRLIQSGAAETGDSVENVADAYSRATRGMQGVDPAKRLELIKKLLPTARAESKLKGAPLGETLQSFIELGHQTGEYDPEKLKSLSSKLSIASLSTNSSLPEFGKTLSYSLPVLHADGLDADTVISLTAAMQNAGINSTKSGTWIRSYFQGLLPKFGAKGDDKHNMALARLGLGSPASWQMRNQDGTVDWKSSTDRSVEIMRERTADMSESERSTTLHDAFGERGSSVAALMLQRTVQDQFDGIHKRISGGGDVDLFTQYSEHSSLQQAQQTWRDTQNLLIDIGQTALPAVNTGLRDLDAIVKGIADIFNGKGWGKLGKEIWDKGIKPDLGPLGRLNTSPDDGADRPPPVDMTDPRRRDDLRQNNAFVDDGVDRGAVETTSRMALTIAAQQALTLGEIKSAISGPEIQTLQGIRTTAEAIRDAIQTLGEGVAAAVKAGMGGGTTTAGGDDVTGTGTGSGITKASFEASDAPIAAARAGGASVKGHIAGTLTAGGESFRFGSGGVRGASSVPAGDYPITPSAIGPWGRAHNAIGLNGGRIWDSSLHRFRTGIELHAGRSLSLITEGCLAFMKRDFPRLKARINDIVRQHGRAYLHVGPHGASIDGMPRPAAPDAAAIAAGRINPSNGPNRRPKAAPPVIHVHGITDPQTVAAHVGRIFAQSRDFHTVDTDFVS